MSELRPQEGTPFYFIASRGVIQSGRYIHSFDYPLLELGNFFLKEEQAEKILEEIKQIFKKQKTK